MKRNEEYSLFDPQTVRDEFVIEALKKASKYSKPKKRFKTFKREYRFEHSFLNVNEVSRLVEWVRRRYDAGEDVYGDDAYA